MKIFGQTILSKVSVLEKLPTLRVLPTLMHVIHDYHWQQNELTLGKGTNYKPPIRGIATLVEEDIRKTWNFGNLGNNVL